jgi:hypothetical protein
MTVVMLYIENNIETTDTGSFADSLTSLRFVALN